MGTHDPSEVHSITSAPTALAEDQWRRMRQYLVQMGVRIVLIYLAVVFTRGSWLMWVCVAGAVVLPYTAVILANAGRDRTSHEVDAVPPEMPREIGPAPTRPPGTDHRVIDHDDSPEDH
ncbi:DUF3099 domain-containing protein [Isoptericola dokdonensis]|jgi:hypothetical protein|uniref:DUF3099 domain-containing protein n=1 Tax=Isoptericola dokdonensis DS-3 TaxID=1300344 RepID=A0A161I024_9MICO|nr:DUF3099 domain-containing protein [Isoptericola dokdonensis]ANC30435.1 hypothetical protein I598_0860 [Isoptericola dokdonensis DS-3]